jgi:hypothetical protein
MVATLPLLINSISVRLLCAYNLAYHDVWCVYMLSW